MGDRALVVSPPVAIPGTICGLGESPVWDPRVDRVRWVDLMGGIHHATDPGTGEDDAVDVGASCGFVALADGGIAYARGGVVALDEATGARDVVDVDPTGVLRINDSQVAPGGWLVCGTMGIDRANRDRTASLIRIGRDGSTTVLREGISICNGLGWSPDGSSMFHVDTAARTVSRYDFDPETGEAENRRLAFATHDFGGMPDGLAIDTEGRIWLAHFGTPYVVCTDENGREITRVELPVPNVTSCGFGGPDLSTLYVTTSTREATDAQPDAGALFAVETAARGQDPRFWTR